jgi:hypothetical protein
MLSAKKLNEHNQPIIHEKLFPGFNMKIGLGILLGVIGGLLMHLLSSSGMG